MLVESLERLEQAHERAQQLVTSLTFEVTKNSENERRNMVEAKIDALILCGNVDVNI